MPKVKSYGRASGVSSGGAPKRASPRESVHASSTATQGLPALTNRRRGARARAGEDHVVAAQEPPSTSSTVQPSPQEALLSPQLFETLVNKVADEVSRHLSPAENPSSLVPTLPSGLHEVPVNAIGSQSSSSTVTTDLLASTVVQGSLADVSAAVTGLVPSTSEGPPPVPGQCFQSVSLPVDARVSEKLREKIWKDEFIDFGSLLANPVLANRFQLTVQNAESGPLPSLCIEPIAKSKMLMSLQKGAPIARGACSD